MNTRDLPPSWRLNTLGQLAKVVAGQSPPSAAYSDVPCGLPFFQGKADFGAVSPTPRRWCLSALKVAEAGDILLSVRAPVGPINIASERCCIGRGLAAIRAGQEIHQRYLMWFMRYIEPVLSRMGKGSTFEAISTGQLANVVIPTPPLPEQRHIADAIDAAMADAEAAARAAERQGGQAIDLVQIARETLFREATEDAEEVNLADLCEIDGPLVNPRLDAYSCLPCVSGEHIVAATGELLSVPSAADQEMISGKYLFRKEAVLYSKLRPYLRKVALAPFDGICSADIYPLRAKPNVEPAFLQAILLSSDFSAYADSLSRRARMPKLNQDQLFSYKAPCPPLSVQRSFLSKCEAMQAATKVLRSTIAAQRTSLATLPGSILTAAFKGQL